MGRSEDRSRPERGDARPLDAPELGGDRAVQHGIDALTTDRRLEDAAGERSRRHWLSRQLDEDSSLAGVLLDLAEHGERVVVDTVSGRRLMGRLATVARDFCGVEVDAGHQVLVRVHAIESVRPVEGAAVTGAHRGPATGQDFEGAVAALGEHRPEVTLTTGRGALLSGRVLTVGRDVVRLELAAGGGVVFVPLAAIWEIGLR